MEKKNFYSFAEECVRNIRAHVFAAAGLQCSPTICSFLTEQSNQNIATCIAAATNPAIKRLLMSDKELGQNLPNLATAGAIDDTSQGVFANVLTNDANDSLVKLYIGAAAGPYNKASRGMKGRIQDLQSEIRNNRSSTVLHHRMARSTGWRTNWVTLVVFKTRVDREMVVLAQTVMIILFGSCTTNSYAACRPRGLKPFPTNWGLNDTGPLRLDGLATYNRNLDAMDPEEREIHYQRQAANGEAIALRASRRRQNRLKEGGSYRVYVLHRANKVERFHITLMTARDGAHVDVVIPLRLGLEVGLQVSRTVHVHLDMSSKNHFAPFATRAAYGSNARRLGIVLSGARAIGSQKGVQYTYWLQSPKAAATKKAEKLVAFLNDGRGGTKSVIRKAMSDSHSNFWSGNALVNIPEPVNDTFVRETKTQDPVSGSADGPSSHIGVDIKSFSETVLELTTTLKRLSTAGKIRATSTIRSYLKSNTAETIASNIAAAVRDPVVDVLLSTDAFTPSRLLCLGGNIHDRSQGIYADFVTNDDPHYFKIYVGAAGSTGHRGGLRRRIQEHLGYAKSQSQPSSQRAQSGLLHCSEMTKRGARPNFAVLVRFSQPVPAALVHIAEALMTILFASWDSRTFLNLRPKYLAESRNWGLNVASPLDYPIVSNYERAEWKMQHAKSAQERARRNQQRRIERARAGSSVRVYSSHAGNDFRFTLCGERITIPTTLATTLGLKMQPMVQVECEIREKQHPLAYAQGAPWHSEARRLGIRLRGHFACGPCQGQSFEKWIQCGSKAAITRSERIVNMLQD